MVNFEAIKEMLKESSYSHSALYYDSSIPEKKLRNARSSMNVPYNEKVYALYDYTIFGSAKEGACFTEVGIYYKSGSILDMVKYETIISTPINNRSLNGKHSTLFGWFAETMEQIKKVNDPIDVSEAKKAVSEGNYPKAIELLNAQAKYAVNTSVDDMAVYDCMYIDTYISMLNFAEAEKRLTAYKAKYKNNAKASTLATNSEARIAEYRKQYDADVEALNRTLTKSEQLRADKSFDEAIDLLTAVELREDFTKKIKKDYYKHLIATYLCAERPDDAEAVITDLYEKDFIEYSEKEALDKQVYELRETLHRRFLQEQRELITKRIETAKMYEKYEIYESASDTLIAALSDAPNELVTERTNLFKMLADMLMTQYEYDDLSAIGKQYSDVTSYDRLGYYLSDKIEEHKAAHQEEYFDHLYSGLLYYLQSGKLERAERYLNNAKEIKSTFDLRCSEVNLAILKLDYTESRNLIDCLLSDRAMFDADTFDVAIEQLETQYENMILAISDMLKSYALANNIEALMAKDGYAGFVDADGLNLPCIAARSANHKILDSLLDYGYGYEFRRTNEGFGIAFLAAMQIDYDAFAEFINARMDSYDGEINCVLNEKMDYGFAVSEVTRDIRASEGIGELEARDIAIRAAYSEAIMLMATLLDDAKRNAILDKLAERKTKQETLVAQMREALPSELQRIDDETKAKCASLSTASSELTSLISDVPEDEDSYRLDSVIEELNDAVKAANEFAKANAEKKKAAKKAALEKEEGFIATIQSRIDSMKAIDSSEITSLLAIPTSAVQLGEYNEENQTLAFTLGYQVVEVEMSSQFAALITSHSDKVQITKDIQNEFDGTTFTVVYNFTFSDNENSCTVTFTKETDISESLTEDKFIDRILGVLKN